MKRSLVKFSLLFILLATMPQLSSGSAFVGAGQNANSSTTMAQEEKPAPNQCKRKCAIVYRRCLHAAGNDPAKRRDCARRYRDCLRHCRR
jgi:hypothetical protein